MTPKRQRDICSVQCGARCCKEVSRLPFMGERYCAPFNYLFIGALPDVQDPTPNRRPFVVEWQVPQELSCCLALGHEGLCTIYEERPIACRRFPLIDGGGIHPFCRFASLSMGQDVSGNEDYLRKRDAIDSAIAGWIEADDIHSISMLLQEERPFSAPFFYNGYLVALLLAAGLDPVEVLEGQRGVIALAGKEGIETFTFILPATEYVMMATLEELMANLEWLLYRIRYEEMVGNMTLILESIFEKG